MYRGEAALRMLRRRSTHVLRKSLSRAKLQEMWHFLRSFRSLSGCPSSKSRPELVRYILGATENARASIWGAPGLAKTLLFYPVVKFAFLRSAIPDPRSTIRDPRSQSCDPRSAIRAIPTETKVPNVLIEWGWRKTKQKGSLFVTFWNIWKSRTSATNILPQINSNSKKNGLWTKPSMLTYKNSVSE